MNEPCHADECRGPLFFSSESDFESWRRGGLIHSSAHSSRPPSLMINSCDARRHAHILCTIVCAYTQRPEHAHVELCICQYHIRRISPSSNEPAAEEQHDRMIWRVPLSDSLPGTFAEVILIVYTAGGQKVYGWSLQLDKLHACFVDPEPTPPSDLLYILHTYSYCNITFEFNICFIHISPTNLTTGTGDLIR